MFKISCEVPICLLENSKQFNDYDYALYHLIDKYKKYKEFYKNSSREVILDNSAYEFFIKKEELNIDKFAECVQEINPSYFIIPDKLNDYKSTISYFEEWVVKYSFIKNKKIGVVQGDNLIEFVNCYNFIKDKVDKIAISFGYNFLPSLVPNAFKNFYNKYQLYALGRLNLLVFLESNNIIDKNKLHHLLGSYLPYEYTYYKSSKYNFIESIDTSFPVKSGYHLKKINMNWEDKKEEILIDDFIDKNLSEEQKFIILYNIKKMKDLL